MHVCPTPRPAKPRARHLPTRREELLLTLPRRPVGAVLGPRFCTNGNPGVLHIWYARLVMVPDDDDVAQRQRDWLAGKSRLSSEVLCASTFLLSKFHQPYQVVWYGLVL